MFNVRQGVPNQNCDPAAAIRFEKMESELKLAEFTLFDREGLKVRDVKLYPGESRDVSVDELAQQVNRALAQISNGDFDEIPDDPDA